MSYLAPALAFASAALVAYSTGSYRSIGLGIGVALVTLISEGHLPELAAKVQQCARRVLGEALSEAPAPKSLSAALVPSNAADPQKDPAKVDPKGPPASVSMSVATGSRSVAPCVWRWPAWAGVRRREWR